MKEFYGEIAKGIEPVDALRSVRRNWIAGGPERSHPTAWAAFVLVGG